MEITRIVKDVPYDESAAVGQRQTLTVAELERFCRQLRSAGAVDHTPVAFRRQTSTCMKIRLDASSRRRGRNNAR